MTKEQTLKNRIATKQKLAFHRIEEIKKWPARIKQMESREHKPLSETAFCEKHGLSRWNFNRVKNGLLFPSQSYFERVERIMSKEGV